MPPPESASDRVRAPLRISLLYASFGTAWVLLGDLALWLRGGVTYAALLLELGKGMFFVGMSTVLLYFLVRREVNRRQQAASQLQSVLDTAPIGIAAVAADGTIRDWNTAAERILGWTEKEVMGRAATAMGLIPAPGTDLGGTYDIAVTGRDGTSIDIRMFASRPDASSDGSRVVVFRDRRPQIEIESALRQAHKLEAVGRLAGGIAHEFNNILTAILGHAVLLLDRFDAGDDRREHVDEVRRGAERAASLTRQLLVFSGKHITRTSSLDISCMVNELRPTIARIAGDCIAISYDLTDELWPVRCDAGQLHQLLLNLVVNAREAMPDAGSLMLHTSNVHVAQPAGATALSSETESFRRLDAVPAGDWVLLRVSDTGRGMSQETLAHLFEPFFTTKEQGTGLGLATVHGIVQQCDGQIRVRSRPGHGAVFDIHFPRASSGQLRAPASDSRAKTGATLLVVEDDDAVRDLTCRILRRSGHRVLSARNGHEALAVLNAGENIHLVIADIVMPGMNGIELGRHVRRDFPDLPILFTSGYVAHAIGDSEGLADGSRFLEKPYRPDQLIERVSELLH